jgi:hypothetical protein
MSKLINMGIYGRSFVLFTSVIDKISCNMLFCFAVILYSDARD